MKKKTKNLTDLFFASQIFFCFLVGGIQLFMLFLLVTEVDPAPYKAGIKVMVCVSATGLLVSNLVWAYLSWRESKS